MRKPKKGLTIGWCINRAKKYIKKYGICLLWFDVVGSRDFPDRAKLARDLKTMMDDLNSKFDKFFPEHNLAVITRKEKEFQILWGDCSWAGIDNAEIIPEIIKYQKEKYPDIPVYWGVAKDGYTKKDWE